MGLTTFDHDVRVLVMAHRDGIGAWVVEFLMEPRTRVGRSGYLESTRKLVRVGVLGVVRGSMTWHGCRVWFSGRNRCGGKGGGIGALRTILGLCRTRNGKEGLETSEVGLELMHIRRRKM